ncbi:MAG: carboxypeptidase-like regulatory domain-containing protein [Oscillospiraceae bacterium]|nr:carboxypeptidase-like regulatory domain-containing protein [Oscillospiraceae bacterium]
MARTENNRRGRKRWRIVVIVVLCLLVCAFIGLMKLGQGSQDDASIEKGTALTDEEAESITFGDISDEDWEIFESANEELSQIIASYSNEDGYIDPDDTEAVLNAVTEQVDALYENGTVTYYLCTSDTISFEFASGIAALYTPALEGYAAGGGDTTILAFDIFSDEEFQGEGKDWFGEYSDKGTGYYQAAGRLASELQEAISGSYVYTWVGEAADLDALRDLPEADILLWNGHGVFCNDAYPVLVTQERDMGGLIEASYNCYIRDFVYLTGDPGYWAITPSFVRKYISLDQGLVYLNACQSGRNDELANAFLYSGAEVVFVNVGGDVWAFYGQWMMKTIMEYMSGEYDGIYHTAAESLFLANGVLSNFCSGIGGVDELTLWNTTGDREWFSSTYGSFSSLDEFLQKVTGGTHVEYRGNGDYTLCPCIRGEVTFAEGMTEDEIEEVLSSGLTVQLTKEDGSSLVTADVNEDGTFYFNDVEAETTYVISSYGIAEQSVTVRVEKHSYAEVSLEYSKRVTLEGYVYDTDGAPLSGVTVSADMTGGSNLWGGETQTNDEGYYALEVYGENTYALTYSKSGYTKQETTFEITSEMFEEAQAGVPCTLEDVELSFDLYARYAEIVQEYEDAHGAFNLQQLGWCVSAEGVNYLQLVDMDGDGVEELLIGYMDSFTTSYFIEVWTYKEDEAKCVGNIECYLRGIEVVGVCTTNINGTFAIISGGIYAGYTGWTYDGEALNAVATYTDDEFDSLATTITYLNAGNSNTDAEKAELMGAWDAVRETKEALSCITDAEKALVAYQFTLLYDDTTGWYAADNSDSLKFEYIYVDDDDVPELVVSSDSSLPASAYLYTYYDGQVNMLGQFGYYGDLEYSEKNNVILSGLSRQGYIEYYYYEILNGTASLIHYFSCSYDEKTIIDTGEWVYSDCKIDNVSVSESVYSATLSEITDDITFTVAGHSTGQYVYQAMGSY